MMAVNRYRLRLRAQRGLRGAKLALSLLARTDQPHAPWHLVEGDSKRWARVKVLETTIRAMEDGMRTRGLAVPEPAESDGAPTKKTERRARTRAKATA